MSDDGVMADAPHPGGRPSKYQPEFAAQARKLCEIGATDEEMAEFFGVSVRTLYRWKLESEEFRQALKVGKDAADDRVEASLYHKAVGYTFAAVKILVHEGAPVYAPYREHVAPDTTAALFWLKNRRPDKWRDRREQVLTGPDGGAIQVVTGVPRAEPEPQS